MNYFNGFQLTVLLMLLPNAIVWASKADFQGSAALFWGLVITGIVGVIWNTVMIGESIK